MPTVKLAQLDHEDDSRWPAENRQRVARYAARMKAGDDFPPVLVTRAPDGDLTLVDGYHRVAAARRIGRTSIIADVMDIE